MAEYVEKEKTIKLLTDSMDAYGKFSVERSIYMTARQKIKNIPAADVASVVHGEWILKHVGAGHYWECSSCHKNPCIYVTENTKFCPNCGAKMDGGKSNGKT